MQTYWQFSNTAKRKDMNMQPIKGGQFYLKLDWVS